MPQLSYSLFPWNSVSKLDFAIYCFCSSPKKWHLQYLILEFLWSNLEPESFHAEEELRVKSGEKINNNEDCNCFRFGGFVFLLWGNSTSQPRVFSDINSMEVSILPLVCVCGVWFIKLCLSTGCWGLPVVLLMDKASVCCQLSLSNDTRKLTAKWMLYTAPRLSSSRGQQPLPDTAASSSGTWSWTSLHQLQTPCSHCGSARMGTCQPCSGLGPGFVGSA